MSDNSSMMNTELTPEMIDHIRGYLVYATKIEKKEPVCNVLKQKRDWIRASEQKPEKDQRVVMHLMHTSEIDGEDPTRIFPKEDCQIGTYNHEEGYWVISPPHPKYDYSRLSKHSKINDGVVVTHWAEPVKNKDVDELNGWDTRFDKHGEYKFLRLEIDPEHEEEFYRALLWAANFIARSAGPDMYQDGSELRRMYERICDLQWAIDQTQYYKPSEPDDSDSFADWEKG